MQALGEIDRVGYEVDRQARPGFQQARGDRALDRPDAALLVERVAVVGRHLRQHVGSGFIAQPADQRLVGEDVARFHVDDRLERHRKVEAQPRAVAAAGTSGKTLAHAHLVLTRKRSP